MKPRKTTAALCVAAAFAGGAAFAAIGTGDATSGIDLQGRGSEGVVPVHEVAAPSAGAQGPALATAAKKKKGVRIRYFQESTATTVSDQQERIATLSCPAKHKALGGYFLTDDSGVLLDYSAVSGLTANVNFRLWTIGVINGTGGVAGAAEDRNVAFGVICAQGVK